MVYLYHKKKKTCLKEQLVILGILGRHREHFVALGFSRSKAMLFPKCFNQICQPHDTLAGSHLVPRLQPLPLPFVVKSWAFQFFLVEKKEPGGFLASEGMWQQMKRVLTGDIKIVCKKNDNNFKTIEILKQPKVFLALFYLCYCYITKFHSGTTMILL